MRARLNRVFSTRKADTDKVFRVLIVYEDYPSGQRAIDTYQRLRSQFSREFDFRISIWSFDALWCDRLNKHAVHDAVMADIIILATPLRNGLPAEIKRWVSGWVSQSHGRTAALIALLGRETEKLGSGSDACDYLRDVAGRAGIDFLMEDIEAASNGSLQTPAFTRPGGRLAFEGWGLNE